LGEEEFNSIDFNAECNESITDFVFDFDVESCEHELCDERWQ